MSSSAGISLEGSKDSRLFPYFSEMTDHHGAAAAVREGRARSGGGGAADGSRKGRFLFCDHSPLLKKKRLDLLMECITRCNIQVLILDEGFKNEMAPETVPWTNGSSQEWLIHPEQPAQESAARGSFALRAHRRQF